MKARLVIVGSGIVGCSAAYHLTKQGWRDILVVDKGDPFENDGSTSHAPGGLVALVHSKLMTRFAQYSSTLFEELVPYQTERNTYNAVGNLELAISQARWQDLKRLHGTSHGFGVEAHLLAPKETQQKLPWIDPGAIVGSLFVPRGAIVAGWHVSAALAREAVATGGARFVGSTKVTDIEIKNSRVAAVLTANPELSRIECEQVLLCTNIWGPVLGDKLGVPLPLLAYEHQYVVTKPLAALSQYELSNKDDEVVAPLVRELDSTMYYRQHWDAFGVGSYWHEPRTRYPHEIQGTAKRPFTPSDFTASWEQAQKIMPLLSGAELETKFNGIFAFTVDAYPILGKTPVEGFWTAVGSWITHAGGVGKSIAEWMTHGTTEWDMRRCDVSRFLPPQTTHGYVRTVCDKNYREVYDIVHPRQPLRKPRNVRLSPFDSRLREHKAAFTTFAGLELADWYEENDRLLEKYGCRIPTRSGWAAEYWSPIQGAEHLETREKVGLFDLTGLSILQVRGRGAAAFVDYLCSNRMDRPVGSVVYTTWLTPSGGVKRDLTVARTDQECFWMFVGEGTRPQDLVWIERHAPRDGSVVVNDISDSYTALGVWGPDARRVLTSATPHDVSNEAFPYFSCRWIDIGTARALALRVSYAGELGWELHIPVDQALQVWDALWSAGQPMGMIAAGNGALDSLRIEKGYRLWGADVYTEYDPYQAGLGWTVKLAKGDFIGREASLRKKEMGLAKKLACLTTSARDAMALGYEPVFSGDRCVGHVTTANYGYSIGKFIAYAYLPMAHASVGTKLSIEYFGERFEVAVADEPPFDPAMMRLKA